MDIATITERSLDLGDDTYIDWSSRDADVYMLEVGIGDNAVQVPMSRRALEQLRDRLTLTLMLDAD